MKYDKDIENSLINKINNLYISNRSNFTILTKEGLFLASTKIKGNPKLSDIWVRNHLREKHSLVVFAGECFSKFLCFDIDVKDKLLAKWVAYKVVNGLCELGFSKEDIHIATSGNKGYHCLLFIENGTSLDNLKFIYNTVLDKEDLKTFEGGQVEFRPAHKQGVKLELSRNFKNKSDNNTCWFVDTNTLTPITDKQHLLNIEPIPKESFMNIMNAIKDTYADNQINFSSEMKTIEQLKEPHSHKLHKQENETVERAIHLLENGLTMSGTRHNSVLLLTKYMRYMGWELEDCIEQLIKWMSKQDKKYYSSTEEYALSEVVRLSKLTYEKGYNLITKYEPIKIYKSEIEKVSEIRNKNLRLIMYSLLIHSKRYSLQNGVFYMSYNQIAEMVGLSSIDKVMLNVNKLIDTGFLEVVDRNIKQKNSVKNKPNKYKINFISNVDEKYFTLNYDKSDSLEDTHNSTIVNLLDLNTVKKHLPTRQYLDIRNLYLLQAK